MTTGEFVSLAEQVSGQDLGDLFDAWLYTPSKPVMSSALTRRSTSTAGVHHAPAVARSLLEPYGRDVLTRLAH